MRCRGIVQRVDLNECQGSTGVAQLPLFRECRWSARRPLLPTISHETFLQRSRDPSGEGAKRLAVHAHKVWIKVQTVSEDERKASLEASMT